MAQRRSKVGNSKKGKHSGDIALAICYELSVPEHAENAFKSGAEIYIASVAKSVNGVDQAIKRLSDIASKYSMTVLMSNCVGQADGEECGGKTSIWNNKGLLVGQLDTVGRHLQSACLLWFNLVHIQS